MPSSSTSISASNSSAEPRIVSPPLPITAPIFSGSILIDSIARRVLRELLARPVDRLGHLAEDEQAALAGLLQRVAEDLEGDAGDLDVHLQGGDPLGGAGDLEVHVAEVVLDAGDVGEDDVVVALLDQPHRDAGDRAATGTPAACSAIEEAQTEPIDEEPLDSSVSETTRIT